MDINFDPSRTLNIVIMILMDSKTKTLINTERFFFFYFILFLFELPFQTIIFYSGFFHLHVLFYVKNIVNLNIFIGMETNNSQ